MPTSNQVTSANPVADGNFGDLVHMQAIAAFDPSSGELLWLTPHGTPLDILPGWYVEELARLADAATEYVFGQYPDCQVHRDAPFLDLDGEIVR